MRLYISGPMRSKPDRNRPAFLEAETLLRMAGYRVYNPARCELIGATFLTGMRHHLGALLDCDGVAHLEGWKSSEGAFIEVQLMRNLGLPVRPVDTWLTLEPEDVDER